MGWTGKARTALRLVLVGLWLRGRARGLVADSVPSDLRFRRRAFAACAASILGVATVDFFLGQFSVLFVRLIWAVSIGLAVLRPARNALRSTVQLWVLLISSLPAAAAVVLAVPRGESMANLATFVALPLAVALMSRGDASLTTATALGGGALVLGLCRALGLAPREQIAWGFAVGSFGFVAWAGARFVHRANTVERDGHSDRLRLARQLSESERRRVESERLASLGRLSAGVAHEVNNPLAFALANVAFALETLEPLRELDPEVVLALRESEVGMKRIQQIVLDLRTFARGDPTAERRGDPRKGIESAVQLASVRMKMISFALQAPPSLGAVRLDERRLSQVLLNLLVNAVDAVEEQSGPGGPQVRLAAWREGDAVCIDVEDNGPGLSAEAQRRLFEPFATTKAPGKGTGLGLAVSREFIAEAGGTLTGRNLAQGARFSVRLPALEGFAATGSDAAARG